MKKRPNIIIFNPDEMRYDAMSHMGNPAAETPFLDEFAGKDAVMLTEGQGAYFEQEILDYMKFGLIDMIWDSMDENGAREMLSQFKDAEGINGCSVRYEGHT